MSTPKSMPVVGMEDRPLPHNLVSGVNNPNRVGSIISWEYHGIWCLVRRVMQVGSGGAPIIMQKWICTAEGCNHFQNSLLRDPGFLGLTRDGAIGHHKSNHPEHWWPNDRQPGPRAQGSRSASKIEYERNRATLRRQNPSKAARMLDSSARHRDAGRLGVATMRLYHTMTPEATLEAYPEGLDAMINDVSVQRRAERKRFLPIQERRLMVSRDASQRVGTNDVDAHIRLHDWASENRMAGNSLTEQDLLDELARIRGTYMENSQHAPAPSTSQSSREATPPVADPYSRAAKVERLQKDGELITSVHVKEEGK